MKKCPECKTTYRDGIDDCYQCKIQLVVVKRNVKDKICLLVILFIFTAIGVFLIGIPTLINNWKYQKSKSLIVQTQELEKKAERKITRSSSRDKEIYRYIETRIWNLPSGTEAEDALIKKAARKFGVSYTEAKDIYTRQVWLGMQ